MCFCMELHGPCYRAMELFVCSFTTMCGVCGRICRFVTGMRLGRPVMSRVVGGIGSTRSMMLIGCDNLAIRRSATLHGRLERTNIMCGMCGGAVVRHTFRNARYRRLVRRLRKAGTVTVSTASTATPTEVLSGFTGGTPTLRLITNVIRKGCGSRTNVRTLTKVPSERRLLNGLLKDVRSPVAGFTHILGRVTRGGNSRTTTRWFLVPRTWGRSDGCSGVAVRRSTRRLPGWVVLCKKGLG